MIVNTKLTIQSVVLLRNEIRLMEFGIFDFFYIIGALAFFIYGMKMMSDGIQRAAGSQLRNILRTMTKNRFLGVFTGFLTTSLVQSSSATTVMTVSFVNAGLLTLTESAGVMMGANIGTTITGWLIAGLQALFATERDLDFSLSTLSIPLFALAVPMILSSRGKIKHWGEFIIGFAILFLGLSYLKEAVPDLEGSTKDLDFLISFADLGFFSRVFFVLVGALVTIIVQSSSAAMAITMTMCVQGWLPFEVAASMILGENIGTTITAEIASLVGNTNAKRSARIHSLFNVIGVTWMVILMPLILPLLGRFVNDFMGYGDPFVDQNATSFGLSSFHTLFNLLNVLLLIGFVNLLVRIAIKTVPSKGDEDDDTSLKFISTMAKTPELALVELQKETAHFGEVVSRMSDFSKRLINSVEPKDRKKLFKKIKKYEKITDTMEVEITQYITRLSNEELSTDTSQKLRSILNICNDLERIGDVYYQISKNVEQKIEHKAFFTPDQRNNINDMIDKVNEAFVIMNENLNNQYDKVDKTQAVIIEKEINAIRNKLRKHNVSRIGDEDYNVQSAIIYNNLFSALEKVGDHIINVTEALVGEI